MRKARSAAPHVPIIVALVSAGLLVALFLAGAAAESYRNRDVAATPSATHKAAPAKPKAPGVGDAVRDGKFQFVVARVDCSQTTVGLEHLKRTATGKFCIVSVFVKNIADQPQLFFGSAQRAYDSGGAKYSDDELAGFYANKNTQTFLRKIDPGHQVEGKVVFDIPKAARLVTLELHDSYFSGGVKVTLM